MQSRPKARPWLVALAAAATMLVLIGALGNPPTTRSLVDNPDFNSFSGRLRLSLASFSWHLTDLGNDYGHIYLANLLMDIAVVVLVFLFVAVITARSGSFGRTFLGVWTAVIAAAVFAGYVRSSVVDEKLTDPSRLSKPAGIFFSVSSPGASLIFAAVAFGLVAALVAALIAVLTRRNDVVAAPAPYAPAPYGTTAAAETAPAKREPWTAPPAAPATEDDTERTTQLPAVDSPSHPADEGDDHTRELPRIERE